MSGKTDQFSGSELTGQGDKTAVLAASGVVKTSGGRCVRILMVSGTGSIDVYDGTSAGGTHLWSIGTSVAGAIYTLDVPTAAGIYVALGATTTVTVVYT